MSSKHIHYLFVIAFLLIGVTGTVVPTYAQANEEEVSVVQRFTIVEHATNPDDTVHAAGTDTACEITAELQWHRKKQVKVGYRWHGCTTEHTVRWELVSIRNATGSVTVDTSDNFSRVYNENWPALTDGDRITLRTWIDEERQADVVTEYKDKWPIWARIHTRSDAGGACFRFTGRVDPWGVFTAGEHSYRFELNTAEWETPWLVGPDAPTVDWHVAFYRDAALTQLRSEYWFNDVENPCYTPEPPACDGIALSVESGTPIPVDGTAVAVTVNGRNGSAYRIVAVAGAAEAGQVMAGPEAVNLLHFHAMPNVTYQAQVFSETHGWTDEGCTFVYTADPLPVCRGVNLSIPDGSEIPAGTTTVDVRVNGDFGSLYQITNGSGEVKAGPAASPDFRLTVLAGERYRAHVYHEHYGWTEIDPAGDACEFGYIAVLPANCTGVALTVPSGSTIPEEGVLINGTVQAERAAEYRIMDLTTGEAIVTPNPSATFTLHALPLHQYEAQVKNRGKGWTGEGCGFTYTVEPPQKPLCVGVALTPDTTTTLPESGAEVHVVIAANHATEYQIVDMSSGRIVVAAGPQAAVNFTAMPHVDYQAQVRNAAYPWSTTNCDFGYAPDPLIPVCTGVELSIPSGSRIPADGVDVTVTVNGQHGTLYQIVANGTSVTGESSSNVLTIHAQPGVLYQAQVRNTDTAWTTIGCTFGYELVEPACNGVALSVPAGTVIPASGTGVDVTIAGAHSTAYRIVDMADNRVMAGPSATPHLHLHAMPQRRYQAQVRTADTAWWSETACAFGFGEPAAVQGICELYASHYGDPGGLSLITAWVEEESTEGWTRRVEPTAITSVVVNWDNHGTVTYPTAEQSGPWVTNEPFELNSRPEVHDVGFGAYRFEAWVTIAGIESPAYCQGTGNAPDHDNVIPDPGPFAADNPEGKFVRGSAPSRLPTVGRVPFDAGNGADRVELILWAFEKEGRGINARITGIANEGKPLARIGMASVSDFAKFDGLNAREGIVYGFQISEHGPWSPLFCPKPDGNPTTITVYWGAGGQTWLSDWAAYGDCWWLTIAAALNGWVTVDESVATYNALQPVIDWNGHRNLVFSLAQDRETGLGPRMQDEVIGLQAREWQGPVVPESVPADFAEVSGGQQATE